MTYAYFEREDKFFRSQADDLRKMEILTRTGWETFRGDIARVLAEASDMPGPPDGDPDAKPADLSSPYRKAFHLENRNLYTLAALTPEERSAATRKAWESRERAKPKEPTEPRQRKSRAMTTSRMVPVDPKNPEHAERIRALVLPPAWTDVHLSESPTARLQATGRDAAGRTQYRYSAKHNEEAAAEKFQRIKDFTAALPELRRRVEADLKRGADVTPAEKEAAAVVYLVDKTAFRVGSDDDTGAETKAYGASTLEAKHVTIDGNAVTFKFTGKSGVENEKTVTDSKLAQILRPRIAKGGRLFDTNEGKVLRYMQSRAGDFKTKDFRTYHGTAQALKAIKSMAVPRTKTAFKQSVAAVSKIVASYLGNTPTVARNSYIDPAVWGRWERRFS